MRGPLTIAAAFAAVAAGQQLNCYQDFPDLGVTYDLTSLSGTMRPLNVMDNRNNSLAVFNYFLGVCTDFDPNDPVYKVELAACLNTQNDDGSPNPLSGKPGPAFQLGFNTCKRLGDTAANGQFFLNTDRNAVHRSRLASGIQLLYVGGDKCVDPYNNSNLIPRSVVLDFQCYDNPLGGDRGVVIETSYCQYYVQLPSRYGCPLQCTRKNGRVCAGNGICGYDVAGGYAKCFCNKGFSGSDCTTPGDKGLPPGINYGGHIGGGFVGGVIGGMVLAVGLFVGKAVAGGLDWRSGLDLDFSYWGSVPTRAASSGSYAKAPAGDPMFTGGGDGYAPPSEAYAPPTEARARD